MHEEARAFLDYARTAFGAWWGGKVLDVGSGDINGNNRSYFANAEYIGCDVVPGKNVDIVSPCHLLPYGSSSFQVIISSEALEHDMHYAKTLAKSVELLQPGGLWVFTCASTGRAEHGTRRCKIQDSFTTQLNDDDWGDYYKNLTAEDVQQVVPIADAFSYYRFYYNAASKDLYFVGIKRGGATPALSPLLNQIKDYAAPDVRLA